ncbi:hypothetical protein APSETT445_003701 [Aspergillus pseudonomiae]
MFTWGHRQINTWPEDLRHSVEKWLQFVVEGEMAYFLWEDEGIVEFINQFTPESHEHYTSLPSMVEKTDYFRILVATYVGGIKIANIYGGSLKTSAARAEQQALDPLTLTGPEAITYAAQGWLNVSAGLSPGRGKYGNMGSKPITDSTALVHHHGQGSWKKFNLVTEPGSKIPGSFHPQLSEERMHTGLFDASRPLKL